jgi:hypothetical protein
MKISKEAKCMANVDAVATTMEEKAKASTQREVE